MNLKRQKFTINFLTNNLHGISTFLKRIYIFVFFKNTNRMPPKKSSKGQSDHSLSKSQSSTSKKNSGKDSNPQSAAPEDPQIDIQAAIQEMLAESQQRINETIEKRQTNLLNSILQCDNMANSPRKTARK